MYWWRATSVEDKSAPGYVPEHNLLEDVICQRCFRLKITMKFKMLEWIVKIFKFIK